MRLLLTVTALLWCATALAEAEIVTATLILEAGGEYHSGSMEAVHEVILTRSAKRRLTPMQVCLQRLQFSCWYSGRIDQLIAKAKRHPRWSEAHTCLLYTSDAADE